MDSDFTESISTETGFAKVLLIDLENCPSQLHHLPADLAHYLQVVICYAQSTSKVPLNWLNPLSSAISVNKLKIIKMERAGKNSADFGICFLAGALMQELPEETHFVIVSNDTDLHHTVRLLKSHGRSSERIGSQKDDKEQHQSVQNTRPAATALSLYCAHLMTHSKTRPASVTTLVRSIKNKFEENQPVVFRSCI